MPLGAGSQFAGYTVVRLLGSGGMGEVYLARHPRLPRYEALKVLRSDLSAAADFRHRFLREADLAATLNHPNVVTVHDRGETEDGHLWIAMEFVDGLDARALLSQRYPTGIPASQVVALVSAVAAALDHAHQRGLLHRDVKPANIMISDPDSGVVPRIMLSDFGIARPIDDVSGLTVTNMTLGTIGYCAPEQLMGLLVDGRADQYALAATAYHLATGRKLFPHVNPVAVISAHLNATAPLPGDTRPELAAADAIFARALAKDPAERFGYCSDFAAALSQAVAYGLAKPDGDRPTAVACPNSATATPAAGASAAGAHSPILAAAERPTPAKRGRLHQDLHRHRVTRFGALSTAAVVVVATAALIIVPRIMGGSEDTSATSAQHQEAARLVGLRYLEALARGDATAAVALSASPPAATRWLTSDVLRAQLAATPITNIAASVAPSRLGADPAQEQYVVLSAKFGSTLSQARVGAQRKGDQWKLDTTTVAIDIGRSGPANAALKAVAVWDVATDGASPIAVFPGALRVSSSNRYVEVTASPSPVLLDALTDTSAHPIVEPVVSLNDAGRQAAQEAIDNWIHYCFNGGALPADCAHLDSGNTTLSVTGRGDFTKTVMNFDATTMVVSVSGTVTYPAQAPGDPSATLNANTVGTVDLTKDPPAYVRTANNG